MVVLALAAPVVVLAACLGLGRAALRLAGLKVPRGEGAFYSAAAGFGFFWLIMFAVGLAGCIYRPVVLGLVAVVLVIFARDWVWCIGRLWRTLKRFLTPSGAFNGILLAAILVVIALDFVSALAPPSETDALTLHLFAPREYIDAHSMIYLPDNWDQAMAMGPHLVYAAVMLMSPANAADAAPGVLHFLVGSVFVLWVWQFTRRRVGRSAANAAAAALLCMPMMTHLISAPMVDAFFALCAFASLAALVDFLQKRRLRAAVAAGAFAGFAAGAKFSGLAVIAACCISAAAGVFATRQGRLRGLSAAVLIGLAAVAVASPFYIRNWAWTGNPVFPTSKTIFGGPGWERPTWEDPDGGDPRYGALHRSLPNMLLAPWRITADAQTTSGGISGAVTPAFLALVPLAFFLRSRKRLFLYLGIYCVAAFVLVYWTSPRPRSRYYLSIMPALAVFTGAGLAWLGRHGAVALVVGRAVVAAGVALGLGVTLVYSGPFVKTVFGLTPSDEFLSRATDFYDTYKWMDGNLPPDAKILVGATNDLFYCPRSVMRLGASDAYTHTDSSALFGLDDHGDAQTAAEKMRSFSITHIFIHKITASSGSRVTAGVILSQMLERGAMRLVYEADDTRGTRTPFAKPRKERVAVYELTGHGDAGQ